MKYRKIFLSAVLLFSVTVCFGEESMRTIALTFLSLSAIEKEKEIMQVLPESDMAEEIHNGGHINYIDADKPFENSFEGFGLALQFLRLEAWARGYVEGKKNAK